VVVAAAAFGIAAAAKEAGPVCPAAGSTTFPRPTDMEIADNSLSPIGTRLDD
jgi:hypothetical protein